MTEKPEESEKRTTKVPRIIAVICCLCLVLTSIYFVYKLFELDIVSNSICFIIIVLIIFLNIETILLTIKRRTTVMAIVIAAIMTILLGIAGYYINVSTETIEAIAGVSTSVDTMGVYVEQDSEIDAPEKLGNASIGILKNIGRDVTDKGIEQLDVKIRKNHRYVEYDDVAAMTEALADNDVDAIFVNTSYYSLLKEITSSEDVNLKCICEIEVVRVLDLDEAEETRDITKEPFTVYLSGNDNDGKLRSNGRSDVNILMVVDPAERKILLVNTPRDYYVTLAGIHEKDKLTHAGMYGVDTSMKTLEDLYGIDIPYYFRLTFTGFIDLIDAMGGVTVESDVDFAVAEWHFVKGENELSGIEALAFARERYAFADGDRQRGRNQQAVIKGIIRKLSSSTVITNYAGIMKASSNTFETNLTQKDISALINYQLIDRRPWSVQSISVDGKGGYRECYSFPSEELSIMIPDDTTVENAKTEIRKILGTAQGNSR